MKYIKRIRNIIRTKYLLASIFPVLVGSLLPFRLHPSNFSFKWLSAIEFLVSTVLFHSAFMVLDKMSLNKELESRVKRRFLLYAGILFVLSMLIGLHINNNLILHRGVPSYIFVVFGAVTFFAGILYVVPPFCFNRRIGREVIIAEGLGMLPVIGAYLVQVGDITRTVYVASLPIVIIIFLWVWIIEIVQHKDDFNNGINNLVLTFGVNFASRFGVPVIVITFFIIAVLTVISSSINSLFIIILLFVWLGWKIILISRQYYLIPARMKLVEINVIQLYLAACSLIVLSSLLKYE